MQISEILKDTNYKLTQFKPKQIKQIESLIFEKELRGKPTFYIKCLARNKDIKLTPEEIVRQLYLIKLNEEYGYSLDKNIALEYQVQTGSSSKRADIVIFEKDRPTQPYIIIELKKPNLLEGQKQLLSYCKFKGASIGVWTNGSQIEFYHKVQNAKSKTTYLEALTYLPKATQTLSEVLDVNFTVKQLIENDKLQEKTLKDVILEFEDIILAHSGVDSFEEIFKLLFTKLFDELESSDDMDTISVLLKNKMELKKIDDEDYRQLEFRNTGTEQEVYKRIGKLFEKAKKEWKGIFPTDSKIELTQANLKIAISYLQDLKLFNSNLEVVDDAFEYLVNKEQKGNKGQYFTPRYVIDMCIKMLNPKEDETFIDTAAGSCGFPMHAIFNVWNQINPDVPNLFTTKKRTKKEIKYVQEKVFAIDFDLRSVRVGRTLNLIAGDGQTNVLLLNSLDYKRWNETIKERDWINIYNEGFKKLEALTKKKNDFSAFNFDIVMANPPFAGDINDELTLQSYNLGKKANGKWQTKVARDILFIERNINMLKDGGRMAVVLPQGRFNNSSDKHLRDFIAQQCRILAVVGLHGNVFKPHTGTKTSVLLVQKWNENKKSKTYNPKVDDYNIFFATMQNPSKDNSGEKIYVKNKDGSKKKDTHGHFIVDHDLFNHDGFTKDGIAETFNEFAKKENLSFSGK